MERRKLFSDNEPIQRRKLFSEEAINETAPDKKRVRCMDCGYVMETASTGTSLICPKCGGKKFNFELEVFSPENCPEPIPEEKKFSRRKLFSLSAEEEELAFQKSFSGGDTDLELKLKEFSDKEITREEFEKEFSALGITAEELEERGFSEIGENGNIKISTDAYLQSKLFSKMVITITRELDLDADIMNSTCDRKEVISKLEERDGMTPKGIILIKKANDIPLNEDWVNDSGIKNDLPFEFGGESKELPDFKRVIEERYPDAPEDILEILKRHGIIRVDGNHVEINKI